MKFILAYLSFAFMTCYLTGCNNQFTTSSIIDEKGITNDFELEYYPSGLIKSSRFVEDGKYQKHQIFFYEVADIFRVVNELDTSVVGISRVSKYQFVSENSIIYESNYELDGTLKSRFGQSVIGYNYELTGDSIQFILQMPLIPELRKELVIKLCDGTEFAYTKDISKSGIYQTSWFSKDDDFEIFGSINHNGVIQKDSFLIDSSRNFVPFNSYPDPIQRGI